MAAAMVGSSRKQHGSFLLAQWAPCATSSCTSVRRSPSAAARSSRPCSVTHEPTETSKAMRSAGDSRSRTSVRARGARARCPPRVPPRETASS